MKRKLPKLSLHIIASCLQCEKEIPLSQNIKGKLFCSIKCLKDTIKSCEEQNGPGTCGYDKSEVCTIPKLYKRVKIKKQTEQQRVKKEGRY